MFNLSSPEDTLLHKLRWYRQWNDILGILLMKSGTIDRLYLRHWAAELGVTDLLECALAESSTFPEP